MTHPTAYQRLEDLVIGDRFRFYGLPDQTATLVYKDLGRATIRYDNVKAAERSFIAEAIVAGEKVRKQVTIKSATIAERPCALGAQVVKLRGARQSLDRQNTAVVDSCQDGASAPSLRAP